MPYKTPSGRHYHEVYGCHDATIACKAEGLIPCTYCCHQSSASNQPGTTGASITQVANNSETFSSELSHDSETTIGDSEYTQRYRDISDKISALMEDYGYTDSDRFMNEMADYFHGRMLGSAVPNDSKHGWDAFLVDEKAEVHPFESKISSVYQMRYTPPSKFAGKLKVPSATFNDTTEAKLEELSDPNGIVSLGVRKGSNEIAFSVALPSSALVPHLKAKMEEHKQKYEAGELKSPRSSQTLTMMQLLQRGGQIVANAPKEEVAEYLKSLSKNYAKYADKIITTEEWRANNGFRNEDEPASPRCELAMAGYIRERGTTTMSHGAFAPEMPFDDAFVSRAVELNEAIAQFMDDYGYDDADRLHNDAEDHLLAQQLGIIAGENHGKHGWDASIAGKDGQPIMIESKINSSFGAKKFTVDKHNHVKWSWKSFSATFNDTTDEKIAKFRDNRGMLVLGCRQRMDRCQFAVCIPTAKIADTLESKMKEQQAKNKRATQRLSMNQLLDMGAQVVIFGDKEEVLAQIEKQVSAQLYRKYRKNIISLDAWREQHGVATT